MEEQVEARLAHGSIAVLGEVMRRMAGNPDLRQIFVGEVRGAGGDEAGPRGTGPPATRVERDEGRRVTDLGPGGGPRQERGELRGGGLRRGGESSRQGRRGDHPYRLELYGRDGVLSGRQAAPARRSGATASATSGGEYTGDSARRSRTRGRGTPSVLSLQGSRESSRERSRLASDRKRLYAQRNFLVDNGRGESRRDHGGKPRATTSGAERKVPERDTRGDGG